MRRHHGRSRPSRAHRHGNRDRRLPPASRSRHPHRRTDRAEKADTEHEALLASSYRSCLLAAEDVQASSIALCCISTGVFGYPKTEAAVIAVRTVREVLPHCQSLTKVVFNAFDPIDESIYRGLLGPDR